MPLPVSSSVFIPNPLTPVRAAESGFNIGKQSSDFANITEGAFKGIGFVDDLANSQSVREARKTQSQNQTQQVQNQTQQQRYDQTTGKALKEREIAQRDRQLDIAQQRADDTRAISVARESRLRSELAIKRKKEGQEAEYNSAMSSLISNGNPDPFIAIVDDPRKQGELFQRIAKEDPDYSQAAINSLEDAIASGRIAPESLPKAQAALRTLEAAPEVKSSAERKALSGDLIYRETGFKPESTSSRLNMRATKDVDANPNASFYIDEVRADGSTRSWPYEGTEDIKKADVQRAINDYNQQNMKTEEISAAIQASIKGRTAQQQLQQGSQQSAPVRGERGRQNLGTLTDPEAKRTAAKDAVRLKLQNKLRSANGQ